jgi:predicted RNase H-like nuclease (RuvC/YqgF family)
MATNYEYDDEDDDTTTDVVGQLRKVNRTLEKRVKEQEQELANLKNQTRQRTVKDVLQAKGLNPKIAAFIPQDIDSSEEAITTWVNEYGDVFGIQTPSEEKPAQKSPEVMAQARINNLVATGTAPDVDEDAFAKIAGAKTREDLDALLGLQ